MSNENNEQLDRLSGLLENLLGIFNHDRSLAIQNYNDLKGQLDRILSNGFEISEDAKLESEINKALKLVFESSKKLETVIETISKILIQQLNNESREKIATTLTDGGLIPTKPVNIHALIDNDEGKKT